MAAKPALATPEQRQWAQALAADIDSHFAGAHQRLEAVYRREFYALSAVLRRHRRHWRDIPADLAALPRSLWRLLSRRSRPRPLTGKEGAVAALLSDEVIDLAALQALLLQRLRGYPDPALPEVSEALSLASPEQAEERLQRAVARWGLSQDSSRDILVFIALGLAGRGLSDKVIFGSASVLGASGAASLYIANQGWLGGWWANWFGVPGWVSVAGAAAGMFGMLLLSPLLSPFVECAMNRLWRRRRLHRLLDEVQRQLQPPLGEQVWQYGTYLQFVPDILLLLRQWR